MPVLGRPRAFNREMALDAAMLAFWRKGFSETSMSDLCEAMGIRSPSLYAAFGSKENLYQEAVERYIATIRPLVWDRLEEGATARASVEKFLMAAAADLPDSTQLLRGCMVTLATPGAEIPGTIPEVTKLARADGLRVLRARLDKALHQGELPLSTDLDVLSRFYLGVFQGMSIQARDGANHAVLTGMAQTAMLAWPDLTRPNLTRPAQKRGAK